MSRKLQEEKTGEKGLTSKQENDLNDFFVNKISVEDFAVEMRKLIHATIQMQLKKENTHFSTEIQEPYYWCVNFLEAIDPVLNISDE